MIEREALPGQTCQWHASARAAPADSQLLPQGAVCGCQIAAGGCVGGKSWRSESDQGLRKVYIPQYSRRRVSDIREMDG